MLITDGYDEHSSTSFEQALAAAKKERRDRLRARHWRRGGHLDEGRAALRTPGEGDRRHVVLPGQRRTVGSVHSALADDVQNRYLLTYTPSNQLIDGSWREIAVNCGDPRYAVRTRAGYFAPKPSPIRPTIEFTAIDPQGRYLDVSAEDLEVVENGVPQKVEVFHEATQPLSIVLALDNSGSMRRREGHVVEAAWRFVAALRPEDKLAVLSLR